MTRPQEFEAARSLVAQATAYIEGKFESVAVSDPSAYVTVTVPEALKRDGTIAALTEVETTRIYFEIVSSYDKPDETLHPTAGAAIAAWLFNMGIFLSVNQGRKTLYWRRRPEIDWQENFETRGQGWKVYSRLGVAP